MKKSEHIKKFRKHLTDVHGDDALKDFGGSELESLCIGYIMLYIDEKANEKELLKKAYLDGINNGLMYDYNTPNFETWYNQLKNQKDND